MKNYYCITKRYANDLRPKEAQLKMINIYKTEITSDFE